MPVSLVCWHDRVSPIRKGGMQVHKGRASALRVCGAALAQLLRLSWRTRAPQQLASLDVLFRLIPKEPLLRVSASRFSFSLANYLEFTSRLTEKSAALLDQDICAALDSAIEQ